MAEAPEKLYYSISEVAEMVGVKPYVLRFWEKEFPTLKPKKNNAGNRMYQKKEIEFARQIKELLYERGFTIAGARTNLKTERKEARTNPHHPEATVRLVKEIRKDLSDLLKLLT